MNTFHLNLVARLLPFQINKNISSELDGMPMGLWGGQTPPQHVKPPSRPANTAQRTGPPMDAVWPFRGQDREESKALEP